MNDGYSICTSYIGVSWFKFNGLKEVAVRV